MAVFLLWNGVMDGELFYRDGKNEVFLASHDPTMKALIFKTVERVPEIIGNNVF